MTVKPNNPIAAGRCLINIEAMNAKPSRSYQAYAGVRILQASTGGEDCHYVPPSDCYLYLTTKDAQELASFFSGIARNLQGTEP